MRRVGETTKGAWYRVTVAQVDAPVGTIVEVDPSDPWMAQLIKARILEPHGAPQRTPVASPAPAGDDASAGEGQRPPETGEGPGAPPGARAE